MAEFCSLPNIVAFWKLKHKVVWILIPFRSGSSSGFGYGKNLQHGTVTKEINISFGFWYASEFLRFQNSWNKESIQYSIQASSPNYICQFCLGISTNKCRLRLCSLWPDNVLDIPNGWSNTIRGPGCINPPQVGSSNVNLGFGGIDQDIATICNHKISNTSRFCCKRQPQSHLKEFTS